jgi:hypothetical protein
MVGIAGGLVWRMMLRPRVAEPIYQGKPLSVWLDELNKPLWINLLTDYKLGRRPASVAVLTAQGTNMLPWLINEASLENSSVERLVGELLEKQTLIHFHFAPMTDHQARARTGLLFLKEAGATAVAEGLTNSDTGIRYGCVGQWELCNDYPDILFQPLLDRLHDPAPRVRGRAANALGMLHQQPDKVVEELMALLDDRDDWVRSMAALGLSLYRDKARAAAPKLREMLPTSSRQFEFFATNALRAIK